MPYLEDMYTNYHGHYHYCNRQEAPEAYVVAAIEQGTEGYGFSSHASLPYELPWPVPTGRVGAYYQESTALQQQYFL